MKYTLQQGSETITVAPLSNDQSVEELYRYANGSGSLPDELTAPETATLFLWRDLSGTSLVFVQDDPASDTGGSSRIEFGLPTDESGTVLGRWVVQDDPSMFDSKTDGTIEWKWQAGTTAGGAFRGGVAGVPFADDLKIDINGAGQLVPFANPWHFKRRYDQPVEGFEPPVYVLTLADNADNFKELPDSDQPKQAYELRDGKIVVTADSDNEPSNDVFFVLKPGQTETKLKFIGESAGYDNRIVFRDRTLIENTNTEPTGTVYSLPGIGSAGFSLSLTPLNFIGVDTLRVLSGSITDPEITLLDPDEPLSLVPSDAPDLGTSVTGSATTFGYVPGDKEAENPLRSTFPNEEIVDQPVIPAFDLGDGVFHGDEIGRNARDQITLPSTREGALNARKHIDGLEGAFRQYRHRNQASIEFETRSDETIDRETIQILVNGAVPGTHSRERGTVTVADRTAGGSFFDPIETFQAETSVFDPTAPQSVFTVLEEGYPEQWPDIISDLFSSRLKRATSKKRYMKAELDTFETPTGEEVEGVRVATVYGTSNPFPKEMINNIAWGLGEVGNSVPFIEDAIPDDPVIYSWLELTVLANGTTLVRVEDCSYYPRHDGYVNGQRAGDSGLDVVFGTESSDEEYSVATNEPSNNVWNLFKRAKESGASAYNNTFGSYLLTYRNKEFLPHPVMAFGTRNGQMLDRETTLEYLPDTVLPPFTPPLIILQQAPYLPE